MVTMEELKRFIADVLQCDFSTIEDTSGLGHHPEWDSLAHVGLMTELEQKYHITVSEENIAELNTVEKILEFIIGGTSK